jgi:hypothetical protein
MRVNGNVPPPQLLTTHPPPGTMMNTNVIAAQGAARLHALLTGLAAMFPEKEELAAWMCIFENTVQGVPEMEAALMERWHSEMTTHRDGRKREPSLYEVTRGRDIEALLASGVWVLDEIDVRGMYYDADVLDEDRAAICAHLDKVNTCAEALGAIPGDMMQSIMSCVSTLDREQPVTNDTIFTVLQSIIGCRPEDLADDKDAVERLAGWSQHLMESFSGGGMAALQRLMAEATAESGAPLPDMAALADMVKSRLMGAGDTADGADAGEEDAGGGGVMDMMALASMMSGAM